MVKLSQEFRPMLEGCLSNRAQWAKIEEGKEEEQEAVDLHTST